MRLFAFVIFSLSSHAFADGLQSLDGVIPQDAAHTIINAQNLQPSDIKDVETAKDIAHNWLHINEHSKIIFTLQQMKTSASAQYYLKVQICKQTIRTDCLSKNFRSENFDASDVGTSRLDIKFSTFERLDWMELAKLSTQENPQLKVSLMKVTSAYSYRPDLLQSVFHYDLEELMEKKSLPALAADPSIRFEMQMQARDLKD